jgi:26S proteasome regulatory subunit N7
MVASTDTEPKLLGAGQDEGDATAQDLKIALAHMKFDLQNEALDASTKKSILKKVDATITEHKMSGIYQAFCSRLGWTVDQAKLVELRAANEQDVKALDEKIEQCGQKEGDEEVRAAMLEKADYLCNIGDKEQAWKAYEAVEKKSPGTNHKITIAFCKIRLEILLGNWSDVKRLLEDAKQVCEQGGDWEKKNRLMVCDYPRSGQKLALYVGIHRCMYV